MISTLRKIIYMAVAGFLSTAIGIEKIQFKTTITPEVNTKLIKELPPKVKPLSIGDAYQLMNSQLDSDYKKLDSNGQRSLVSSGGESSGGGGMGLIAKGQVHLADLTRYEDTFLDEIKLMSPRERESYVQNNFFRNAGLYNFTGLAGWQYFQTHRKAPSIGYRSDFSGVFPEAFHRLFSQTKYPLLKALAYANCDREPVLLYQHMIFIDDSSKNQYAYFSNRFPVAIQQPLVFFRDRTLVVSAPLVGAMDEKNRTALGVHECLRHLNSNILQEGLATAEIEALTREMMQSSFASDNQLLKSAQIKMNALKEFQMPENHWVRIFKIRKACDAAKPDLGTDEARICHSLYDAESNLYSSQRIAPEREKLFCIIENPETIPGWNKKTEAQLVKQDIRNVYDWFKNAAASVNQCDF
ncbi:hypothetical protein [Bdellovibrio sp. HCB209]|uniref:hypothetical protein n=1 Tax=Bdellovibrio sp. HCB209 TaxID=3394354 RepID=UPI0039B46755